MAAHKAKEKAGRPLGFPAVGLIGRLSGYAAVAYLPATVMSADVFCAAKAEAQVRVYPNHDRPLSGEGP
ncbi:protein of unknown function [Aminobacter niigataensis]|nr:protein of unknown function [Aminobacter niigataensis]